MMGNHIGNYGIIKLALESKDMLQVKDYTSEVIALKLSSDGTINKVSKFPNKCSGSIAVLWQPHTLPFYLYYVQ